MARDRPHHTPATTPPTHHRHTPHTTHQRCQRTAARSGGDRPPPPAAKPSQEWRGVAHGNLRQEWRGTNHTTHQPQSERQPREGKGRNSQAAPPPPKKKGGGGGGARANSHSHQTARKQHKRRPNPPDRGHRRQDPQRGTGGPPSQNRQHQARNSGPAGKGAAKQADTHTKKKKPGAQPERKGKWGETTRPGTGTPSNRKKKSAKNTPREGWGTAETQAQQARPHRTPEPETAGGKRYAHETTHDPKAGRHQSPTTNTTNSRQKRDNTTNRAQTHPPKTPATNGRG